MTGEVASVHVSASHDPNDPILVWFWGGNETLKLGCKIYGFPRFLFELKVGREIEHLMFFFSLPLALISNL